MRLALLILAAGLSSRMGALKPLLPVGESSALLRSVRLAADAGIDEVIVVTGNGRERISKALQDCGAPVKTVFNGAFKTGMFSSVKAGAAALPEGTDGFFLLPADVCAVRESTLRLLAGAFEREDALKTVYPSVSGLRGHPPLIPARFIPALGEYDGGDGLRGFLSGLPSIELETGDPGIALDMDTPEDYARMLRYLGYCNK
jgi:CTP:molybdopterin cytidylyltransferase MocA